MSFYRQLLEKLFPNNKRAIDQNLKRGDMFYLSGIADKGPLARKVIVLDIEGTVAEVDTWLSGKTDDDGTPRPGWSGVSMLVDLTRARYVGPVAPTPDAITDEQIEIPGLAKMEANS